MFFPQNRLRRNRKAPWVRELVAETILLPQHLIYPIFLIEGKSKTEEIKTLPGIFRYTVDKAILHIKEAKKLGIKMIALFPVVPKEKKSTNAEESYNKENLICRAIKEIKFAVPDVGIMADVALDPYTPHGHDGVLLNNYVDNDQTIEILCAQSLTLAKAGADVISPSDMMDGRVFAIRESLESEGYVNTQIMSYAVKYASCFYGPFREAVGSKQGSNDSIDKSTYQLDFRNRVEALNEVGMDVEEGADMLIIKPGMPYLDIISEASANFEIPIFAYQVSGEYAMLKFAAEAGAFEYNKAVIESLTAFKRAGCSGVVTYAALDAAKLLNM